jgi:hypothetical protein
MLGLFTRVVIVALQTKPSTLFVVPITKINTVRSEWQRVLLGRVAFPGCLLETRRINEWDIRLLAFQ